jgi:putative spermidine/putrescine transport system substrate-binding protein
MVSVGPLLEYMPDKVKKVPTTAEELLAYARENKNRFMYARPANSGPGRTFIMGLPYILGDSNPKDPTTGWDKTWEYLKALGENIEYYPSGTTATMKELGEGSRDMIASTTGWDINPRVLGIIPKEAKIATLKGFHWVIDGHYMVIPKGLPNEKIAVVLDLMNFLLKPESQAYIFDEGYLYPGPAVKGVTLEMALRKARRRSKNSGAPSTISLSRVILLKRLSTRSQWCRPSVAGMSRSAVRKGSDQHERCPLTEALTR